MSLAYSGKFNKRYSFVYSEVVGIGGRMLEMGSKVRKLMVGIIVIFLLMLETEVVLSSTRILSKGNGI
ncbi:MAG: hypothetical protein V3T89_02975 [bacterium]